MKTYFVIADVHGFYTEMKKALYKNGFRINNKEHTIILCGDAFDRGKEAIRMFKFLKKLQKQNRLIYIRGNHEDLLFDCAEEMLNEKAPSIHHYTNGTVDTVVQFIKSNIDINKLLNFIEQNTIDYFETNNYIFVHGWIPCYNDKKQIFNSRYATYCYTSEWRKATKENWKSARWDNGMECWAQEVREPNKTIVCGHWNTSYGHFYLHNIGHGEFEPGSCFDIFKDDGIIAMDACTGYTHKVNVLIINEEDI